MYSSVAHYETNKGEDEEKKNVLLVFICSNIFVRQSEQISFVKSAGDILNRSIKTLHSRQRTTTNKVGRGCQFELAISRYNLAETSILKASNSLSWVVGEVKI